MLWSVRSAHAFEVGAFISRSSTGRNWKIRAFLEPTKLEIFVLKKDPYISGS